jgi:hypothetical protein
MSFHIQIKKKMGFHIKDTRESREIQDNSGDIRRYQGSKEIPGKYQRIQGFSILGIIGYLLVLPGFPWYLLVLPGFPWYLLVLPGFPWYLLVLPGFPGIFDTHQVT